MDRWKECPYCGKKYNAIRDSQITCGGKACIKEANRLRSLEKCKQDADKKAEQKKNRHKQPTNQQLIAEENEIALSLGLDYGLYKAYLNSGYLNTYLKIRFHNESAVNADDRTVQQSWIGGGPARKRIHEVAGCKV